MLKNTILFSTKQFIYLTMIFQMPIKCGCFIEAIQIEMQISNDFDELLVFGFDRKFSKTRLNFHIGKVTNFSFHNIKIEK